jgi:hypothetical protein
MVVVLYYILLSGIILEVLIHCIMGPLTMIQEFQVNNKG